jgi:hypothetical protein
MAASRDGSSPSPITHVAFYAGWANMFGSNRRGEGCIRTPRCLRRSAHGSARPLLPLYEVAAPARAERVSEQPGTIAAFEAGSGVHTRIPVAAHLFDAWRQRLRPRAPRAGAVMRDSKPTPRLGARGSLPEYPPVLDRMLIRETCAPLARFGGESRIAFFWP